MTNEQQKREVERLEAEEGETIVPHATKDGAIGARVTGISPGPETRSVTVRRSTLSDAFDTDLHDSYPSAYVHTDGETVAVTDHKTPANGADVRDLADAGEVSTIRTASIQTSGTTPCVLVDRDTVIAVLDELEAEVVTVYVEDDKPLLIESEDASGVGVAPQVRPEALPGGEAA